MFLCLFFASILQAQKEDVSIEKALSDFQTIESSGRFIDDLSMIGDGGLNAYNLPIGIKKIIGNVPFTLAVANIKLGSQFGELTLFMRLDIPQESKSLIFGATDVRISNTGDLVGDIQLKLLNNISFPVGNMGTVTIRGNMDESTGAADSQTYVSLECNGDFKELSLDAEITLNPNTFKLASDRTGTEPVKALFKTSVFDWNDLIVNVDFPPFEIKGADGFIFSLSNAILDLSDKRNALSFHPKQEYLKDYFTLPSLELWRGIYVDEFSLDFPEWFKHKNTNSSVSLKASGLLIDENGLTCDILAKNLLPIESGDAGGWNFSVDAFRFDFMANNIKAFGFGGQIGVPMSDEPQLLGYEAYISGDEYLFKAGLNNSLELSLFGKSTLRLDPTSYLQMELKDRRFKPRIVMNGAMAFDSLGLKIEEITFKKLVIATEAPFFSVESMGYGGEVKLYDFPISISDINLQVNDQEASLAFDLDVNLMKEKISAGSRLRLNSEHINGKWRSKGLSIDALLLNSVSLPGLTLSGEIRMDENHPVYGRYFGGSIMATFNALSDAMQVNVSAVFGSKGYRYWYVEGGLTMGGVGIPVGPVFLNGFTGGAYYRMSATGKSGLEAYAPNDNCSLGVKAGVAFYIGNSNAVNGSALFEMNFLSSGGIKNIHFYGTANFMVEINKSLVGLDKLDNMRKTVQEVGQDLGGSYLDKLPSGLSGSDAAKQLLPGEQLSGGINAYLSLDYDFPTKTFDADFRVRVNIGGILKGVGQNDEAGWTKLYCSPQTWFIHAGTPRNPVGLQLGLGPLSIKTQSYFMLGDKLETPIAPPSTVLNILGISEVQADYMKYPAVMESGKGVGFGSRFSFDTGNLSFLILYARFSAYNGFDIMLRDMSNYACEGSNSPIGINGWYANGQCYASLSGELGVNVKLLVINKRFIIIKGAAAALLQARLPNPTWIGGYMGVQLNILGGLINSNMKMKFSFGDDCKLVRLDGESSPIDFPLIADLNPLDGSSEVDIFQTPQATFNMGMGEPFDIQDENGVKTYRIMLEDFYVADQANKRIEGKINWNRDYTTATFMQKDVLPPYKNLTAFVSVIFEEKVNGRWNKVTQNGKDVKESRRVSFKTGEAPNYIPLHNIDYCYPVVDQKNFYLRESGSAYVKLKMGQPYLFPVNFQYDAVFTAGSGQQQKAPFRYNAGSAQIDYVIPNLTNNTSYKLAFIASSRTGQQGSGSVIKTSQTIQDAEGENYQINMTQKAAQKIIQEGSLNVLEYDFRSSRYNTFAEKLSSIPLDYSVRRVNSDVVTLTLKAQNYELFDVVELEGSSFSKGKALVEVEALFDDPYYKDDIAPLIYNDYPVRGLTITGRDVTRYGVPPRRAFTLYDGYLAFLKGNKYDGTLSNVFPYIYAAPYFYYQDYFELRNKAANYYINNKVNDPLLRRLIDSQFLFIRQGYYKSRFRYVLPDGKNGTSKDINYYNEIYWRK
ncbi:MAG: hypothetical protein LBL58_10820 [Tannerellaceae bacterium]|nr:hypothetical protein [Tannerellaceae bacterium]